MAGARRCPACGESREALAIRCHACGIIFGEWEKNQGDRLEGLSERVAADIEKRALGRLQKTVGRWLKIAGVVAVLVVGTSLGGIYWKARQIAETEVAKLLAEPAAKETFTRVAEEQAREIIAERVEPAVKDLETFIDEQKVALEKETEQFKAEFAAELKALKDANEEQLERRSIQRLALAAKTGVARAWDELYKGLQSDDKARLRDEYGAAILDVAEFYGQVAMVAPMDRVDALSGRTSAPQLIEMLKSADDAERRAAVALLRRDSGRLWHKGLPQLVLGIVTGDGNLYVRVGAVRAFNHVADRRSGMDFNGAVKWYEEHGAELEARLPALADLPPPSQQ